MFCCHLRTCSSACAGRATGSGCTVCARGAACARRPGSAAAAATGRAWGATGWRGAGEGGWRGTGKDGWRGTGKDGWRGAGSAGGRRWAARTRRAVAGRLAVWGRYAGRHAAWKVGRIAIIRRCTADVGPLEAESSRVHAREVGRGAGWEPRGQQLAVAICKGRGVRRYIREGGCVYPVVPTEERGRTATHQKQAGGCCGGPSFGSSRHQPPPNQLGHHPQPTHRPSPAAVTAKAEANRTEAKSPAFIARPAGMYRKTCNKHSEARRSSWERSWPNRRIIGTTSNQRGLFWLPQGGLASGRAPAHQPPTRQRGDRPVRWAPQMAGRLSKSM